MLTRQEILSSKVPLIFKNILTWEQKNWTIDDWKIKLENYVEKFSFREGYNKCSTDPLWEKNCGTRFMTMRDFLDVFNKSLDSNVWLYFDYKHIDQWFNDILKDISWECVGFPERRGNDSTLWIGTEGAHTACHMDTYGCNMVAQVYGKKMWLLFDSSQTCNLKPTRVPYEESSIYSGINFSCTCHNFPDIKEARCIILEPGDVLYIPKHWWHYVENITSAISINTWIPTESDDVSRIEESLVKFFISSLVQKLDINQVNDILNPNERDVIEVNSTQNINELNWCLNRGREMSSSSETEDIVVYDIYFDYLIPVHTLHYIINKMKRKCKSPSIIESLNNDNNITFTHIINAFCHPDIISLVRKKLQNEIRNNSNEM